jgi:hypothetical protein
MTDNNSGFRVINGTSNIDNDYNDIWRNIIDYLDEGLTYQGVNSISEDPLFIDPRNDDFNLRVGSSCIDAGDPDPYYNDPNGTRADMGALPTDY